jgi:hypothetical protein
LDDSLLNEILPDWKCAGYQIFICRLPGPGTWKSVWLTQIWVVRTWHLIGQHKLHTLDSKFCKTTCAPSKAMSGDHLLLRELRNFDLLPPLSTVDPKVGNRNLASHRVTQASHPGFQILQDNLCTIKGHVRRSPAAPGTW